VSGGNSWTPSWRAFVAGLLLSPGFLSVLPACQTARDYGRRADLDVAISRFHTDLRWSRYPQAARSVHPDLQPAFLEDWGRWGKAVEIKEIDVTEVYDDGAGKAEVVLHLVWIERATQIMKERMVSERWEFDDQRMVWILVGYPAIEGDGPELHEPVHGD